VKFNAGIEFHIEIESAEMAIEMQEGVIQAIYTKLKYVSDTGVHFKFSIKDQWLIPEEEVEDMNGK
jgi:hypothetical protein